MPQISLYIDEPTLKRVAMAAKTEKLSLSRYVTTKLRKLSAEEWPDGYGSLFGAIEDDSFCVGAVDAEDVDRESL